MLEAVNRRLDGASPRWVGFFCGLAVLGLGYADYWTGAEVSFSIFYAGPVLLAAWYANRRMALLIATASAAAWLAAETAAGKSYAHVAIPVWNSTVRWDFFLIVALLASRLRLELDHVRRLANTDSLTDLANSRVFYESVDAECARSRRYGRPFTVAYLDLDNFKHVNDAFGHDVGDNVLRTAAECLRGNTRETDLLARLGGDEFAGLFPETGFDVAGPLLAKLAGTLGETMQANDWPVTCSLGAVTFERPLDSVRDIVKAADDLMYRVKREGKNNVAHERHEAGPGSGPAKG